MIQSQPEPSKWWSLAYLGGDIISTRIQTYEAALTAAKRMAIKERNKVVILETIEMIEPLDIVKSHKFEGPPKASDVESAISSFELI